MGTGDCIQHHACSLKQNVTTLQSLMTAQLNPTLRNVSHANMEQHCPCYWMSHVPCPLHKGRVQSISCNSRRCPCGPSLSSTAALAERQIRRFPGHRGVKEAKLKNFHLESKNLYRMTVPKAQGNKMFMSVVIGVQGCAER